MFLFEPKTDGIWNHHAKLLSPDGLAGDGFGWSLALYLDTVVVGAPDNDDNGSDSGSVHVFIRAGDKWTHQTKLLAPGRTASDSFGYSVAAFENTVVVGARQYASGGTGFASVFV